MTHGSETRVRTQHLTIRLSPEERAAIDLAADRAGLTQGSYARQGRPHRVRYAGRQSKGGNWRGCSAKSAMSAAISTRLPVA